MCAFERSEKGMEFNMKNNKFIKGIRTGFIFCLLINALCLVTYFGLEFAVADGNMVFGINLLFMIISAIIVFILRKLKINEKIALISNVVLILFGIASIVSIFVGNIGQIFTTDFVMPGPTVKIPSIVLLLVWISIFSVEFYKTEDSKYGILKFILGSILASGILLTVFSILSYKSLNMDLNKNQLIKQIIQGVCSTGIVGYYLYTLKKLID